MTKKLLTTLLILSTICNTVLAQDIDLRKLNVNKFKEKCYSRFCKNGNNADCNEKMKNLELLANYIKADDRVTNIGIATFFFATVYTETGVKNFNPTEEIGKGKGTNYGNPDKITGQVYYGRGWVQLTHKENYKKATDALNINFLKNPNLVLEPKNAYEIMYLSTINGWLETYRSSVGGGAGKIPIKVTDFLDKNGNIDYTLTRSVINANSMTKPAKDFEFKPGCFIPPYESLDASKKNKDISAFFEEALLYGLGIESPKLQPLIEHNELGAGCYIQDDKSNVYCQLTAEETYFNLKGKDEKFETIQDKNLYPKGYDYGFQNKETLIFIKETLIKKENMSFWKNKYEIIIRIGNKEYKQILKGFCGS
jgi:hypothetical protein